MSNAALKSLAGKFDKLSMKIPGKSLFKGRESTHPYEYLVDNFPTFNDFYDYFADAAPNYRGQKPFGEALYEVYHHLRDLPVLVNNMNQGLKPANMERVYQSMRILNELTKLKYIRCNSFLAEEHKTKH